MQLEKNSKILKGNLFMKYLKWNPESYKDNILLKEAYLDFSNFTTTNIQNDIPLIVRFFENPKYDKYRFNRLKGSISLFNHDILHILLKQNMDMNAEAFVIGYTMGNANKNTFFDIWLYKIVSQYLFPKQYRFSKKHLIYFDKGFKLGTNNSFKNIHQIDFKKYFHKSLREIRKELFSFSYEERLQLKC